MRRGGNEGRGHGSADDHKAERDEELAEMEHVFYTEYKGRETTDEDETE